MAKANPTNLRVFANRRSASDLLRKMGVKPQYYAELIGAKGDKFVVDTALVAQLLTAAVTGAAVPVEAPIAEAASKPVKPPKGKVNLVVVGSETLVPKAVKAKAVKPAAKKAATKRADGRPTVAARCLELFLAGKSNKETWALVSAEYGLDEDKAHYPAWYRSYFRRQGKLPKLNQQEKAA